MTFPPILLEGGPLNGTLHDLKPGFPPPDMLGLPNDDKTLLHWCKTIDSERAYFCRTEETK